jgi:hypothetical protein
MNNDNPLTPPTEAARLIHRWKLPPKLASMAGWKELGIYELTGDEEIMATKRAGGDPVRLSIELVRQSLADKDRKAVSLADGTADTMWSKAPAKVRTLMMSAYAKIHMVSDKESEDFFATQESSVG